jgi:hypothetical protein
MRVLLMFAAILATVTATAALWLERRRPIGRRCFAALVSIAVTLTLFSVVAWAATAIVGATAHYLIWAFVVTLALLFALRLYRELTSPPPPEPR